MWDVGDSPVFPQYPPLDLFNVTKKSHEESCLSQDSPTPQGEELISRLNRICLSLPVCEILMRLTVWVTYRMRVSI